MSKVMEIEEHSPGAGVVQDCNFVLVCQWLRVRRCAGALATSRSDALCKLRALDCMIDSLITRAMREHSESLLCVGHGKSVDYFV